MTDRISLLQPDDWHLHLRDGEHMRAVLPDTARRFRRAIVMPNLKPPVTTTEAALAYRQRILQALPAGTAFEPLMTLYLTDNTSADEIRRAKASGFIHAAKLYPAGATTHSDLGVTDIRKCESVMQTMAEVGMPLLVHGEVTHPDVDIFDRERLFLEEVLAPLIERLPTLKVVLEHVTTEDATRFVEAASHNMAATITAHHLLINRNALFQGGIRPHMYCLPIAKREHHRLALVRAATSGSAKFFLGTDSAPHAKETKENDCGCAGIYTAHAGIELYAEAFDAVGALDKLEGFASRYGPDFYGLPRNSSQITLIRRPWCVPAELTFGASRLVGFRSGSDIPWTLE